MANPTTIAFHSQHGEMLRGDGLCSDLRYEPRADRHSDDGVMKMVVFCDLERRVVKGREHRKRGKSAFAAHQG